MEPNEELSAIVCLKENFPQSTEADATEMLEDLRKHPLQNAHDAITAHRRELGAKAFRPSLNRLKELATQYSAASAAAESRANIDRITHERESCNVTWRQIDGWIAGLSDEQIAAVKERTLSAVDPALARVLSKLDPRKSRLLQVQMDRHGAYAA
jgi:hypothetical protein